MKDKAIRIAEYEQKINEKTCGEWQKLLDEVVHENYTVEAQVYNTVEDRRASAYLVENDGHEVEYMIYEKLMSYLGFDPTNQIYYDYVNNLIKKRVCCTKETLLDNFLYSEIKFVIR